LSTNILDDFDGFGKGSPFPLLIYILLLYYLFAFRNYTLTIKPSMHIGSIYSEGSCHTEKTAVTVLAD